MFLGGQETLTTEEKSYIQQFKDKAKKFWSLWNNLDAKRDIAASDPTLQKEYTDVMDRGSLIKESIQSVTAAIDKAASVYQSVRDWLASTFGLSGVALDQRTSQLGIIPLIPIAVIVAALAAMSKWFIDAYQLNTKLDKFDQLRKEGYTADQASAAIEKMGGPGLFGGAMGNVLPLALLGIGAFMLMRGK